MKILFLADSHLMLSNRMSDFLDSLYQVTELAETHSVDRIIHLGDVYHKRLPHPKEQEAFRMWLKSLPCPIDILIGNHDENLDTHTLNELEIFDSIGVKIIQPPTILEQDGMRIYLDHCLVEGAKLGPSNMTLNLSTAIPKNRLLSKKCDMYFLGHIHKYQVVNQSPLIMYVGSVERVDFAERNEDKGVILLDTLTKKVERLPLKIRKMIQLEIDAERYVEPVEDISNAIVKVVIRGSKQILDKFDTAPLRKYLANANSIKEVFDVVREEKKMGLKISEKYSPIECFLEYCSKNKLSKLVAEEGKNIINECEENITS